MRLFRRSASYFNSPNLSYEGLRQKTQKFHRRRDHSPQLIKEYILANRRLQKINQNINPQYKFSSPAHDLGLLLNVGNADLENELWDFLRRYWLVVMTNDDVVRAYVLTCTGAHLGRAFDLVTENYRFKEKSAFPEASSVSLLLRKLLHYNDYQNSFKLLDSTVCSPRTVSRSRQTIWAGASAGAALLAFSLASHVWMSCAGFSTIVPDLVFLLTSAAMVTCGGLFGLQLLHFPRVSWRPHTSSIFRASHLQEMVYLNRLVTYFEEHHEVNVKNFHISRVKDWSHDTKDDFELILPSLEELLVLPHADVVDEQYEANVQYIKSELLQRKMVWNALNEEKMFLQFWLDHGENFEWVEPDQDPAELQTLKSP